MADAYPLNEIFGYQDNCNMGNIGDSVNPPGGRGS
jgi:hypothetical protein